MAGINKVILVGNLGKDPEIMTYENGVKRAAFSLATTESYRGKDGNWQEQTEWHNIVLWGLHADKNLIKGDKIYLEGRLRYRTYEQEGQKKYITEIQGDKVLKLNTTGTGQYSNAAAPAPSVAEQPGHMAQSAPMPDASGDSDLPF
jgi:single-strand DNA-binding protein